MSKDVSQASFGDADQLLAAVEGVLEGVGKVNKRSFSSGYTD
jgi:hypothetical protein